MSLISIKEVVNNVGNYLPTNELNLFAKQNIPSTFGFTSDNYIQFSLYDVAGNQLTLPDGTLYRHIPLTADNISEYFLISTSAIQNLSFKEYFIDIKKLIVEAGYEIGTFRTKVLLLSKRVGNFNNLDSLWISEISPSRTEIRLRPSKAGGSFSDETLERFRIFTLTKTDDILKQGVFTVDVAPLVDTYVQSLFNNSPFEYMGSILDVIRTKFNITEQKIELMLSAFTNEAPDYLRMYLFDKVGTTLDDINHELKSLLVRIVATYV